MHKSPERDNNRWKRWKLGMEQLSAKNMSNMSATMAGTRARKQRRNSVKTRYKRNTRTTETKASTAERKRKKEADGRPARDRFLSLSYSFLSFFFKIIFIHFCFQKPFFFPYRLQIFGVFLLDAFLCALFLKKNPNE